MNEHSHVAAMDIYKLVDDANRKGAQRCRVGPTAMRLLRAQFAPYEDPPPGVTETLAGLPIEEDADIPGLGWQLHDGAGEVVHAGRFVVHDHDCGEHG